MSKLDKILLDEFDVTYRTVNGKRIVSQEGKEAIKTLFVELVSETDFVYKDATAYTEVLRKKIEAL